MDMLLMWLKELKVRKDKPVEWDLAIVASWLWSFRSFSSCPAQDRWPPKQQNKEQNFVSIMFRTTRKSSSVQLNKQLFNFLENSPTYLYLNGVGRKSEPPDFFLLLADDVHRHQDIQSVVNSAADVFLKIEKIYIVEYKKLHECIN